MLKSVPAQALAFPWWVVLLEGVVAIVVGTLLIVEPQATMALVIQLFGLYWLVDGFVRIVSIFTDPIDRGMKLLAGTIGILAGIAIILRPLWLAAMLNWMLLVVLGGAGVLVGLISLYQAIRGRGWGAAALGVLSLVFGTALLINPWADSAMLVTVYGWLAIAGGAFAVFIAVRAHGADVGLNQTPA